MATADIEDWADREIAAWTGTTLTCDEVESGLRDLAEKRFGIGLYRIEDGKVELDRGLEKIHPFLYDVTRPVGGRAVAYLRLLRDAVQAFGVTGRGLIGIFLPDQYPKRLAVPLFLFQKPAGTAGMLLPDIDFLALNYYATPGNIYFDRLNWAEKEDHAAFAGSTTGSGVLTADKVRLNENARLRAATFFKDRPEATFVLPNIVQYDTPETKALIESLGVSCQRKTWHEQFASRFILSIDGNGATCSRVAIALHSRSVLMKYASVNQLYYFHGMVPWRHYIPVGSNNDVVQQVRSAPMFAERNAKIAADSRAFAQSNLSRVAVLRYSATILARYLALFGKGGGGMTAPDTNQIIDIGAHYATGGIIWAPPGGWASHIAQPILGVTLEPGGSVATDDLVCLAIGADGAASGWCGGRQHCRVTPAGAPLHGLAVALRGVAAETYTIVGEQQFADGTIHPVTAAVPPPYPAPLTRIRLRLASRF